MDRHTFPHATFHVTFMGRDTPENRNADMVNYAVLFRLPEPAAAGARGPCKNRVLFFHEHTTPQSHLVQSPLWLVAPRTDRRAGPAS